MHADLTCFRYFIERGIRDTSIEIFFDKGKPSQFAVGLLLVAFSGAGSYVFSLSPGLFSSVSGTLFLGKIDCPPIDSGHNCRIWQYHPAVILGANHHDSSPGVWTSPDCIAHIRAGEIVQRRLGYYVARPGILSASKFSDCG